MNRLNCLSVLLVLFFFSGSVYSQEKDYFTGKLPPEIAAKLEKLQRERDKQTQVLEPKSNQIQSESEKYIRLNGDLEVATVTYKKDETQVDVVGAIHIADTEFFVRKNIEFEGYHRVLFEMVANSEELKNMSNDEDDMYGMIAKFLELDSQKMRVDYSAKNFVHADLSKEQLSKKMRANNDDMMTVILEVILHSRRQENARMFALQDKVDAGEITLATAQAQLDKSGLMMNEQDLLGLILDPNRAMKLKTTLASMFTQTEIDEAMGPVIGQYLISDRNEKCMEVLKEQVAIKADAKYAIFYGAGHMSDLDIRLKDAGYKKIGVKWSKAWKLK